MNKGEKTKKWLLAGLIITLMGLVFFPFAQNQQSKEKLLDKKKKIEEEINYTKNYLTKPKRIKIFR